MTYSKYIGTMRVQFSGRTSAFQADRVGSIPITRSIVEIECIRLLYLLPREVVTNKRIGINMNIFILDRYPDHKYEPHIVRVKTTFANGRTLTMKKEDSLNLDAHLAMLSNFLL